MYLGISVPMNPENFDLFWINSCSRMIGSGEGSVDMPRKKTRHLFDTIRSSDDSGRLVNCAGSQCTDWRGGRRHGPSDAVGSPAGSGSRWPWRDCASPIWWRGLGDAWIVCRCRDDRDPG